MCLYYAPDYNVRRRERRGDDHRPLYHAEDDEEEEDDDIHSDGDEFEVYTIVLVNVAIIS